MNRPSPEPTGIAGNFDALLLPPHPNALLRWLGYQALLLAGIALTVSLVLVTAAGHSWAPTLIYSSCITVGCGFFIQGGRLAAAHFWVHRKLPKGSPERRNNWPGWPLMLIVLFVGTALGWTVGSAAGNWLTGYNSPALYESSWRQAVAVMLFSLIPGLGLTLYFLARSRLSAAELRAQMAQRQAAENQLRLLESQLEPHMLFNTLANLRVLIGMDPRRAEAMLDQLIAFLRATLQASRTSSHPLSAEFARVEDYLALMKVRMGARLQSELSLPPELAGCLLPPLLLQPLVENAIKHGLEPHVDGGRLEISARRDGDSLLLQVRDTGAGLGVNPNPGTQFGLQQVRERLHTRYGDAASLSLDTAADERGGALATVRLPLETS
nr:histidine kinase [uncultured Roseateles sp.]